MLIGDLNSLGLVVTAHGDCLRVGPSERLDDEIRELVRSNKRRILAELRMLVVCETQGAEPGQVWRDVLAASGPDWDEVADDPDLMGAVALSVIQRREREGGRVPVGWTATAECAQCGAVPYYAPIRLQGCLWCHNRIAGRPVPRLDDRKVR